ncbi:MAG: hypothetical protein COW88_02400 [Candidatus Lloydbacteria bacterium CG22_combo_CG10-13_8_21_14_all_47_15]|uniref:HAD family hydrolase n=1 Tax=Candidatus Lloydbacteria bacterium CG22_combo_CG10-13_8_21_14_all_47_15 TaxID=1974635 RepID=A0A2H0CV75_9BACT|nr:MAG: hypothetical protein COW88_02400 [Candidatus Lloydbacteria bacterium CG22_combo_CG10-13_8_21_14_all_47_15]
MRILGTERDLFIFDLDGVILDLMDGFMQNIIRASEAIGLSNGHVERYFEQIWNGDIQPKNSFSDNISAIWPELDGCSLAELVGNIQAVEREHSYPIIIGSVYILRFLKLRGYKTALCTANMLEAVIWKCEAARQHDYGHFRGYRGEAALLSIDLFDYISTPDHGSSGVAKPDPEALLYLFCQSGIPARRAVFFGDWSPDWEAARAIPDLLFIGVTSGGYSRQAFEKQGVPPAQIIPRLSDIIHIISFPHN